MMKSVNYEFKSRRSMVTSKRGMVASTSPLASQAGLQVLREGGNAADATVAAAAVQNVTNPASTGIGGDCFALYYDAKTKAVTAMNGSGRSPAAVSIKVLQEQGISGEIPARHPHTVTVPGAAMAWHDLVTRHGCMSLADVLKEAIYYAEEGFPVAPVCGANWSSAVTTRFLQDSPNTEDYLPGGTGATGGQVVKLPGLASTFRAVAEGGPKAFYEGAIADAIVSTLQQQGNLMTHEDLKAHCSKWDDPISLDYRGYTVVENPPNGQGLAALLALGIAEGWQLGDMAWDSPEKLHLMIEAMRLAFADVGQYVADPDMNPTPLAGLLNKGYFAERRVLVCEDQAMQPPSFGTPPNTSDTIYLCAVDGEGNACSFINSLYMGFGSGIVAKGTGVFLQNRGANFVLQENHPNALAGGKRPYHTIIPGMLLKDGELVGPFGVMGGFMQPQGHFQVINGLIDDNLNPQAALDRPRWQVEAGINPVGGVMLEEGIPVSTMAKLAQYGHQVKPMSGLSREAFGNGQIIIRDPDTGVLSGGSEPRSDGLAASY